MGELRDPRDRRLLLDALGNASAQVRLAAVQAMRRQAGRDDSGIFAPMLADTSWWVRQAAADALVALPGMTASRLEALLSSVEDRYGQDALRRAVAEGKV